MDVNEKLYKDAHFRLLQFKKNRDACNFLGAVRELISLSDVNCSDQNMTVHGAKAYKTELFAEYFKTKDSQVENGLLPVINDPSENSRFSYQSSQKPLNKVTVEKCKTLLLSLKIGKSKHAVEPNSCSSQSSNKKISDFFLKTGNQRNNSTATTNKTSANLFHKTAEPKVNSFQMPYKTSNSINNYRKENHQSELRTEHKAVFSNKLSKKNKFEEQPESSSLKNKKVCLQSKSGEIGFVSASTMYRNPLKKSSNSSSSNASPPQEKSTENEDSEPSNNAAFKNFDKKIVDIVLNEIMDFSPNVKWSDIAGLDFVKTTVQEIVIWPLLRPDIFTGLRAPPRGVLLFGPPGTGKTLIGKCIATESNSTFFCISASSLASKWVGESEQMVRVLFAAARLNQPSVIFIDEIDSLLSQRSDKDQDFTRKLKTEFLVQFDGAKTNTEERVLVVGATNRPHELDEAARRRFVKRLFVPLPDTSARRQIIQKLLEAHQHDLSAENLQQICDKTEGYSGSDVAHLCKEAAMGPIRSIGPAEIKTVSLDQVRPISLCDFTQALQQVRASVVADDLNYYMDWNKKFGSFGIPI